MIRIKGEYFGGGSSVATSATLVCKDQEATIKYLDKSLTFELDQLAISDRLAQLHRKISFPDGGIFTTPDNGSIDLWLASQGKLPGFSIVSFFEDSWRWVLLALIAIPFILYLLFTVGMPVIAKPLAATIPDSVKNRLDNEIIQMLDEQLTEPTEINEQFQSQISELYEKFSWADDTELLFRKGAMIGANALALPGGTVIIKMNLSL
ncbi:MAG: hypothetical protein ACI9H8_001658 [Lysobacterales bacterium]|jgi:hypothetical protein